MVRGHRSRKRDKLNDDSDGSQKLSRAINSQMNFSSDSDEEKKKKKARKIAKLAQQ